ncbi:LysM peptidoglycan-binding domain-containing protein [Paenibacillus sp. LHD-117]|uniref:LysM peptidoglycan-binding domain-containing protein n=1 Tax=Paenibacillus sp. LHD-117 TaxID=3071412 RepID=UPI0027E164B5|nr:LysM peptidoglycan-binding domain-containing protein [Paenibacillus sp. LHD-117]MDQ6418610.1 LysM peptidoglycan-binding domain-containing protein [Paenibacillus sp. LHD-117]
MKIHLVKKGDTLYFIGQKYNVSIEEILSLNPGITNPDVLEVGMKLKIPTVQGQNGISGMEVMHQHVVKQGDTLWKLSKAWGVPLATMIYANPHLKNPNVLLTGEVVNIPKADTIVPASAMHAMSNPGKTPTGVAHPLHPTSIKQGVQGIVGKLSTAPAAIGKTLTGLATDKKNTAPIAGKTPTGPIVSPVPNPAPAPAPKETKVEPLDTGKVEPLGTGKVEPLDTGKVEPLGTGKVEPLDTGKVEPLGTGKVEPLGTGKVEPLGAGKVEPLGTGKVEPLGTGKVEPLSSNIAPLGTGKVEPLSAGTGKTLPNTPVSPLSANNVAPLSTNVSPLSTNNMAPLSTNNAGPNVSPTPYAGKKALPIEKPVEHKVSPAHSEYMQNMDMNLFQQYYVPATEAIYMNHQPSVSPYGAHGGISPYGEMAPMFPYDCPPGTFMTGYPLPMPYGGGGPGWGYPEAFSGMNENGMVSPLSNMSNAGMVSPLSNMSNAGMVSPLSNMSNAGMVSPLSNMSNAGMVSPLSNMSNAGMVSPLSNMPNAGMVSPMSGMPTKGLPSTMSTLSMPSYDGGGYPMTYPPYAPYPLWQQNAGVSPVQTANTANDDCGCGGKREDELEQPKQTSGKFAAPKPRKKGKKAAIRTVAPRPKKKTTIGSRPWLNR